MDASESGRQAELIVTNARIRTLDPGRPQATAFAISDGKFVAVGSDAEVEKLATPRTFRINAHGRVIVPGR